MEFQVTGVLMKATPEEWQAFKLKALHEAWQDTPGILEMEGEHIIRCTEDDETPWAYYEPHMQLLYLSHPANYTFVYPQE